MCKTCINRKTNLIFVNSGMRKYTHRIPTNEDKILKSIEDYIHKEIGIFEDNILCLIGKFTDINMIKGKMCSGCNDTIIIKNSPDCYDYMGGLFCKNCYFICPCCDNVYVKSDGYFADLTDKLISIDCNCDAQNKHLEKYGEYLVCEECINNHSCSCDCGEFIICDSCEDVVKCDGGAGTYGHSCDNKYFQECSDGHMGFCGECSESFCGDCRKLYRTGQGELIGSCCLEEIDIS